MVNPAASTRARGDNNGEYLFFRRGSNYFEEGLTAGGRRRVLIRHLDGDLPGEVTVARHVLFYVDQSGRDIGFAGELRAVSHGRTHKLIKHFNASELIAADRKYIVWATDHHGFGRVTLSGTRIQRHRWRVPPERGGGVADGLAIASTTVYVSRCMQGEIGRFSLTSPAGRLKIDWFVRTGHMTCPEELTVANGYLYWTATLPIGGNGTSVIGRAPLAAPSQADRDWVTLPRPHRYFPDWLCSDSRFIYFASQQPSTVGRISINSKQIRRKYLDDGTGAVTCGEHVPTT